MTKFEYLIKDECGIHARPAGLLVKQAKNFTCAITIEKDGETADVKKLFALMGLCIKQNDKVTVSAEGNDEQAAIEAIKDFFSKNL